MKNLHLLLTPVLLGAMLGVTGCVVALGNSDGKRVSNPTLGQELIDLKAAKDAGAISEADYREQKKRLLENGED